MMVGMKTVSALDVRKHFGQLLDEAAAGERIIIERAGQPRAALVPLEDLKHVDPDERRARQKAALREIRRMARLRPAPPDFDAAATIRQMRDERAEHIMAAIAESREKRS
jgi:prevent-host-death family protein